MKIIARFLIRIRKPAGQQTAFAELQSAAQADGWSFQDSHSEHGDELRRFRSTKSPLDLGLLRDSQDAETFQVLFGQTWLRCTLAGGWAKPGFLPDDIVARIVANLQRRGCTVDDGQDTKQDDDYEDKEDDGFDDDDDDDDDDEDEDEDKDEDDFDDFDEDDEDDE